MQKEIVSKESNLVLINFNYIFLNLVEKGLLNDLHQYDLLSRPKNPTVRKLFYHHIVFNICNYLLELKHKEKAVIFFEDNNIYSYEICQYIGEDVVHKLMLQVFKKIDKLLPIRIIHNTFTFEYFLHKLSQKSGVAKEVLMKSRNIVDRKDFTKFTYEKCKKFTEKEGLTFLSKSFFNNLKSKQLMFI